MEKFKYRAMSATGRTVRGVLTAANETDLFTQLKNVDMELIDCSKVTKKRASAGFFAKKITIRDLIQFFMNIQQMQRAGIPILDTLADIRDTADNDRFRDIISEIYKDVSEGSSLSEAMANHPKVFNNLQVSLIASGEENGDIQESCTQLIAFLKWVDAMQGRVRKATRYPMILLAAVLLTVVVMMAFVVPQIVGFIRTLDQELPFATTSLIAVSDFFTNYWMFVIGVPVVLTIVLVAMKRSSAGFAYKIDEMTLKLPIMGELIRKIEIARFCQTFGALFKGGIDILKALNAASNTVSNKVIHGALSDVSKFVKEGDPLSESLNKSGEFPSMVIRMVRVGEESGNLTGVLDQVAEFYTNDVDEEVQKVIAMIEPALTGVLGGMILWIAVGVFGPIYSSFESIDF